MHRSRLHCVLIDSAPDVADAELAFWAGALGREPRSDVGSPYASLGGLGDGLSLAHQRLDDGASRIHLDIETDDVEAEVARLERLGATRVGAADGCIHLRDPAGMVLCVLPVQSDDFAEKATVWE